MFDVTFGAILSGNDSALQIQGLILHAQGAITAGCSELTIKGSTGQKRELPKKLIPKEVVTLFLEH